MRVLRTVLIGGAALFAVAFGWLLFVWPPPSWYRTHWPAGTAFMQLRQGQLADAHALTPRRYQPVEIDSMTDWLGKAAIAAEDGAFYQHHGVDWRAMREALGYRRPGFALHDAGDRRELRRVLGNAWSRRDQLRGASTITQQLAKNIYLSPSRNPLRKLKEAVIAYRLEWALPKDRILALYLNVAEFGPNLWGVEAASRAYFGKSADRLSLDEAAELIATLPHPLTSNPAHHPGRTLARAQLILRHLRGENVEVPVEEPVDSVPLPLIIPTAPLDTVAPIDTARVRADTAHAPTVPADTLVKRIPDTTAPRRDTTRGRPPDTAVVSTKRP
jgi:monofunctional biosynthetic peptidoglycan transglycosylase